MNMTQAELDAIPEVKEFLTEIREVDGRRVVWPVVNRDCDAVLMDDGVSWVADERGWRWMIYSNRDGNKRKRLA